jgi:[acyl-carrier-protein] S-malonyltransferase
MQKSLRNKTFDYGSCFRIIDNIVEEVCASIDGIVVAANYNCPGQLVISGE